MKIIKCDTVYSNYGVPVHKCQFLVDEKEIALQDFLGSSEEDLKRMSNIILEFLDIPCEPHIPFFKKEFIKK